MKRLCLWVAMVVVLLCPWLHADTIVLKSGDTIDGNIVRTVGSNVTVRTATGFSTYHVNELNQEWVDAHYDKIFTAIRNRQMNEIKEVGALFGGLVGKESLARSIPFLTEYRKFVLPISGVLIILGLVFCFFGWKLFQLSTMVGGIFSGIILGLMVGGVVAMAIAQYLPENLTKWGTMGLFLLIGIPLASAGAFLGRRYAMIGERFKVLGGIRSRGWMGALFSLSQFALYDHCVIWGRALFGSILFAVGAYCTAVLLLKLPDDHLQLALFASVVTGLMLCIFGSLSQLKALRLRPPRGYRYR